MRSIVEKDLKELYKPSKDSHKGMNGKLLVIGGSKLFHSSIFWAADVASRVVDLVHFSSPVMENNDLARKKAKDKFWNGIVVSWEKVEDYVREDDCILIGPGMPRDEGLEKGERPTSEIVNDLLGRFENKKWVVDGGALQEMDKELLNEKMIVTPHAREFERVFGVKAEVSNAERIAKKYGCVVLLKGVKDVICSASECVGVEGGNKGMTKGGTGDVLAGLVAALYCKNDGFLAAKAGSLINKRAGDEQYKRVGLYYNASDLVEEVGKVMKQVVG